LGTGRQFESPAINQIQLDINKSQSAIEFIAEGVSNLTAVKTFGRSYRSSEKPKTPNSYEGEQILISTGRVVINSKQDSTLIASKESVGISSNTINQEAAKEICLESPKIYLGRDSMISNNPEPILLGNQVEEYLRNILDEIIGIADGLSTASIAKERDITVRAAEALIQRTFLALGVNGDPNVNPRVVAVRMWHQGKVAVK
jgi:hypothetical protein